MVDCLYSNKSPLKKILTKMTLIERYLKREHSAVETLVQSFQARRKLKPSLFTLVTQPMMQR